MPHLLLISSQSDYLIWVFDRKSHIQWQTVQIRISWLLQKPTDMDLHCLLRQGMSCSAREALICHLLEILSNKVLKWTKHTTWHRIPCLYEVWNNRNHLVYLAKAWYCHQCWNMENIMARRVGPYKRHLGQLKCFIPLDCMKEQSEGNFHYFWTRGIIILSSVV